MFTIPKPERSLSEVRDEISSKQAHVDFLRSEMYARAAIVADQDAVGRVDELARADYLAARERFEEAAKTLTDDRAEAVKNNSLLLMRLMAEDSAPCHLRVVDSPTTEAKEN